MASLDIILTIPAREEEEDTSLSELLFQEAPETSVGLLEAVP